MYLHQQSCFLIIFNRIDLLKWYFSSTRSIILPCYVSVIEYDFFLQNQVSRSHFFGKSRTNNKRNNRIPILSITSIHLLKMEAIRPDKHRPLGKKLLLMALKSIQTKMMVMWKFTLVVTQRCGKQAFKPQVPTTLSLILDYILAAG